MTPKAIALWILSMPILIIYLYFFGEEEKNLNIYQSLINSTLIIFKTPFK